MKSLISTINLLENPLQYKILKILSKQSNGQILLSQLTQKMKFTSTSSEDLRILLADMFYWIEYDELENDDFLLEITPYGSVALKQAKYSKFINIRTLWINRAISYVLGIFSGLSLRFLWEIFQNYI